MKHPLRLFKAELFKALAHPGRLKMLEALKEGEKTVSELQELLDSEPASASQHLAELRHKNIVHARKEGTTVFYSVVDPRLFDILEAGREMFNNHVSRSQEALDRDKTEAGTVR
ncbi:MAG: winged helix-turn-helix transcriptional regulator [Chloroflexi bacterium]|nr:winged helix-turn-helix transcriptional regulator [Chloroflexota bacterium]MCH8161428.1 winged helix-turn-helix transcriptional regulator [Chloroflexota bacterium]